MKVSVILLLFLLFIGVKDSAWGQADNSSKSDSIARRYSIGIQLENQEIYSMKFIISEIRSHIPKPCTNIFVKDKIIQFNTSAIVEEHEVIQWISPYNAVVTSFNIGNVSEGNEVIEGIRK